MHSLNHAELAGYVARERVRSAAHLHRPSRPPRPRPPARARAAYAVARVASRLDRQAAKRAVA